MAALNLRPDLIERPTELARREQRPVEAVLESMLAQYAPASEPESESLDSDDDAMMREFRQKLYRIARDYWRQVGNEERLKLTDAELDVQFWLIDHEGIPRLKSEQGAVDLPDDPLDALDGLFADSDETDASTAVADTMAQKYRQQADQS